MAVTKSPDKTINNLLLRLQGELPGVAWHISDRFSWDPREKTIFYNLTGDHPKWSLLHEAGHVRCGHQTYDSDIQLLKMEVEAWQAAKTLAEQLGESIDQGHIEDCLDSYRDWLHQRSCCPNCSQNGIERSKGSYRCINCSQEWTVSEQRFCRVYRKAKR